MSNPEASKPPEQGSRGQGSRGQRRAAYRPGVVAVVVALAVVVGMLLKTTTRHHRLATGTPEQTTAKNSEKNSELPIAE
jgi:hypothetical protein